LALYSNDVLQVNEFWISATGLFILSLLLCIPLMVRLIKASRARESLEGGLCPVCGYDLRATPDRCPECGTEVSRASSP
jgi:hypothetical protein